MSLMTTHKMKKIYIKKNISDFLITLLLAVASFSGFSLINKPIVLASSTTTSPAVINCSSSRGTCPSCNSETANSCLLCQSSSSNTSCQSNNICTVGGNCLFSNYINPVINLLSGMVALVVIGSIIAGGIQYSASAGDPQKTAKAKARITNSILAFLAYIFLYAFLQFIIPGGLLSQAK